jgi:ABC-2 type transport system ATP-binding protein
VNLNNPPRFFNIGIGRHPGVRSAPMDKLLCAQGLERTYADLRVLAGVDIDLEHGEVLGLLGPNGAGKTTCLQVLSGNLYPSAGVIRVMGVDLLRSPLQAKRSIGYLPERPPLYSDMRVDEYLGYCAQLHRVPWRHRKTAIARATERCGLENRVRQLIGTLSKGFRQRVGIAQAIVHEPDLVILDEPTEGLDPVQLREVRALIRGLTADCGIILSSHILPEVQAVCSKVSILRDGRVLHHARLQQASSPQPLCFRVRLMKPPTLSVLSTLPGVKGAQQLEGGLFRIEMRQGENAATLSRVLVREEWGLAELTPEKTDLERVFFDILGGEAAA